MSKNDLSVEELEALLAEKKKAQRKEEETKRKSYEKERDALVCSLSAKAEILSHDIKGFERIAFALIQEFSQKVQEYGDIRGNSLGGFSLKSEDGSFKIAYSFRRIHSWDERAVKAEELLKDFLGDTIKKKDRSVYKIIMGLLEKNKKGQLEYSRIQTLYKSEDDYQDVRWKEAIKLFKESFNETGSRFSIEFYKLNEKGSYELIPLNFSSL